MIKSEQLLSIGKIIKPHGIRGDMSISFSVDVFDFDELPFFIIEIDGCFVPFVVEEYRSIAQTSAIIKLEGVNSENEVRNFSGMQIFIQKEYIENIEEAEVNADFFIGYKMSEKTKGIIGVITAIDDSTDNVLFVVHENDDELLIPVSEDYILEIDHSEKIIYVDLPEGLLDL